MLYGYSTDPAGHDPLILLADEVVGDIFSSSCALGKWVVDILPFGMFAINMGYKVTDIAHIVHSNSPSRVASGYGFQEDSSFMGCENSFLMR